MVLSHESAGVVEEVGSDVHYVKPGDHVITCLSVFCGHCEQCLASHLSLCQEPETNRSKEEEPRLSKESQSLTQFAQLGSFAQMLVHEHAIVRIREDMPMDRAAPGVGLLQGLEQLFTLLRSSQVAQWLYRLWWYWVISDKRCGVAGAARIIAIDMVESVELARKFGATDTVNASDGNSVGEVIEMTGGGVHYSFEAIGLKIAAEQAFQMLRAGGTATVIGMIPPGDMVTIHG